MGYPYPPESNENASPGDKFNDAEKHHFGSSTRVRFPFQSAGSASDHDRLLPTESSRFAHLTATDDS